MADMDCGTKEKGMAVTSSYGPYSSYICLMAEVIARLSSG
jgi:hypothetical protein